MPHFLQVIIFGDISTLSAVDFFGCYAFIHSLNLLLKCFIHSQIHLLVNYSFIHSLIPFCWESVRCWVLFGAEISM